ncbi:MAG: hypothetical protein H0W67_09225 [Gemmatimonadales bacterium]|nr:hypothetical protein [Gemmatimonadales bacterium]
MISNLRGRLAALGLFRLFRNRRRPLGLAPALERRRSQIAAENYAARHLLEHTLDRKSALRRLAPGSHKASERYRELLSFELEALLDLNRCLRNVMGGRESADVLGESADEIERLRTEVAWCDTLLHNTDWSPKVPAPR